MRRLLLLWVVTSSFLGTAVPSVVAIANYTRPYELIVHRDPETSRCTHLALQQTQTFRALPEHGYLRTQRVETGEERVHFIARDEHIVWDYAETLCGERQTWDFPTLLSDTSVSAYDTADQIVLQQGRCKSTSSPVPLEVTALITSGDSSNRVDLVFFADGYTANERDKFLGDAMRLAEDISGNHTFHTVKPLLNFWAAFTPSKESGVGIGGKPFDTQFGLYRDGTELRSVWYSKPEVARKACFSLGDRCDYPILMGNDPLYGGLGGEFTDVLPSFRVITPSLANGALVLRHELGHSIIDVGEEYDGAEDIDYFGVNSANSSSSVPWAHWLSPLPPTPSPHKPHSAWPDPKSELDMGKRMRVERAAMPLPAYPWTLLNAFVPWTASFASSGTYARTLVRFSLSGLPSADDLVVSLDGRDLGWAPRGDIGVDRWHYDIAVDAPLKEGEHVVAFELRNGEREGVAQLCNVEVIEYGDESEFVSAPGHYSLYPTYSATNVTRYRPTNEDCLMRLVTTPNFCSVCMESLWHALLRRVDLIDHLSSSCIPADSAASPDTHTHTRTLDLSLVPLAHLRDRPVDVREGYEVAWTRDGWEMPEWANRTRVEVGGRVRGRFGVRVRYWTEEVRVDKDGLLWSEAEVVVAEPCA